jgi:lipopolysaccharide exporter
MSIRRKTILYSLGSGISQAAILLRGIVIARLIGSENMGIAAILIAVTSFGEMVTATGGDRFLIQDRDGDKPHAAAALQTVAIVRGLLLSGALAILAVPFARLFGIEDAWGGLLALALVPFFRGFQSLDAIVQQRALRLTPRMLMELSGELLALAVGAVVAYILCDWRAVVAALIAQSAAVLLVSHLVARRSFRLGYDKEVVRRATTFALPLLASSALLFLALHGDRLAMAVAEEATGAKNYDLSELGRYLVAGSVAVLPVRTSANLLRNVFLPWIRTSTTSVQAGERRRDLLLGFSILVMFYMTVAVAMGGELIELVFGHVFSDLHDIVAVLSIAQGLRVLRVISNIAAISCGDTVNTFWGSLARISGVMLAVVFVAMGMPIVMLAVAALTGEAVALLVCELSLRRLHPEQAGPRWPMFVSVALLTVASGVAWVCHARFGPWIGIVVTVVICLAIVAGLLVSFSPLRDACRNILSVVVARRRGRSGSKTPHALGADGG